MSIADFLLTPTLQRVLKLVLARPERAFTLTELLAAAGQGRGGAVRQIDRLVAEGVLKETEREGKNRRISINQEFLLYPELVSIMRKSFGVDRAVRQMLEPYLPHIQQAFVYGSTAKGTDHQGSDVDVMVIADEALDYLALMGSASNLELELGRDVNLTVYGPEEWTQLLKQDHIVKSIADGPRLELIDATETTRVRQPGGDEKVSGQGNGGS